MKVEGGVVVRVLVWDNWSFVLVEDKARPLKHAPGVQKSATLQLPCVSAAGEEIAAAGDPEKVFQEMAWRALSEAGLTGEHVELGFHPFAVERLDNGVLEVVFLATPIEGVDIGSIVSRRKPEDDPRGEILSARLVKYTGDVPRTISGISLPRRTREIVEQAAQKLALT